MGQPGALPDTLTPNERPAMSVKTKDWTKTEDFGTVGYVHVSGRATIRRGRSTSGNNMRGWSKITTYSVTVDGETFHGFQYTVADAKRRAESKLTAGSWYAAFLPTEGGVA